MLTYTLGSHTSFLHTYLFKLRHKTLPKNFCYRKIPDFDSRKGNARIRDRNRIQHECNTHWWVWTFGRCIKFFSDHSPLFPMFPEINFFQVPVVPRNPFFSSSLCSQKFSLSDPRFSLRLPYQIFLANSMYKLLLPLSGNLNQKLDAFFRLYTLKY